MRVAPAAQAERILEDTTEVAPSGGSDFSNACLYWGRARTLIARAAIDAANQFPSTCELAESARRGRYKKATAMAYKTYIRLFYLLHKTLCLIMQNAL